MDHTLKAKVDLWLTRHRQEIIDDLIGLVRIPSVSVPDEAVPPYGQACRDALQYMFALGARHGYAHRNFDHYVGAVDFSDGEETVGIWVHLDVVPVPDPAEWDYPPFDGTLADGRYLIGRGVQDNKMAAVGVFHTMNCLRDLGIRLRRRYSLYMGTSEETGMEDVRWFTARYPVPDLSLVPDTGFPVCCAQRGSMTLSVELPFPHDVRFSHSNNPSVTPAEIALRLADGRETVISGDGVHAAGAEGRRNAVLCALDLLAAEYHAQAEALHRLAALLTDNQGGSIGAAHRDELSGPLQMAATGIAHQDGKLKVTLFMILPVTADGEQIFRRAKTYAAGFGIHVARLRLRPSCCFPTDHPAVQLLTDTYNQVMQRESKPFVMSGGNYAAYLPNAFGFGPGMPGRQFPPHIFRPGRGDYHQCDESIDMEQMLDFMRVYAMSIVALDGLDTLRQ